MAEKIRGYSLIFVIAHPIFSIIGALVFLSLPKNQQPEPMPQAQRDYFAYGLCDGCGHPDVRICWCSICCPTVRWAANASSPKVNFLGLGFWPLLLQMEVLICLPLIFTIFTHRNFGIFSLSVLGMFVRNRHKIRQVYGLPTWTCGSCMEDICCSCFALLLASPSCKKRCSWSMWESRLHLAKKSTEIELAARSAILMDAEPARPPMDAEWRRATRPNHLFGCVAPQHPKVKVKVLTDRNRSQEVQLAPPVPSFSYLFLKERP